MPQSTQVHQSPLPTTFYWRLWLRRQRGVYAVHMVLENASAHRIWSCYTPSPASIIRPSVYPVLVSLAILKLLWIFCLLNHWVCPLRGQIFNWSYHICNCTLEPLPFWKPASVLLICLEPRKECTASLSCSPNKRLDSLAFLDCTDTWTWQVLVVTFLPKSIQPLLRKSAWTSLLEEKGSS